MIDPDVLDPLDTGNRATVTFTYRDFTCICPVNGGTDEATVAVSYTVRGRTVELGSLKTYLDSYADVPMLHEDVTWRIAHDVAEAVRADVTVQTEWAPLEGVEGAVSCTSFF